MENKKKDKVRPHTAKEIMEQLALYYQKKGKTLPEFIRDCRTAWEDMQWLQNGIKGI